MSPTELFSDRNAASAPTTTDVVPEATNRGLSNFIQNLVARNGFAQAYPEPCYDGGGIYDTDTDALQLDFEAIIPDLRWPLRGGSVLTQETLFDLLEYGYLKVSKPSNGAYHSHFRHYELNFDMPLGRREYVEAVNLLLARGRTNYLLTSAGRIERTGPPPVRTVVAELTPNTGDTSLDDLIEQATVLYRSSRPADRQTGLEKLWDALERLKTLEIPTDKKRSVEALLDHIADVALRDEVSKEVIALTSIGNNFRIRHHEMNKHEVPVMGYDYLFTRLGNVIVLLLKESGRLA